MIKIVYKTRGSYASPKISSLTYTLLFPAKLFKALTLLGDRMGIRPVRKVGVGLLLATFLIAALHVL